MHDPVQIVPTSIPLLTEAIAMVLVFMIVAVVVMGGLHV